MKNKKRKYQIGGNPQFINKTGYLGSELSKLNPYNLIPLDTSKKITTEGVGEDLLAMLYKNNEMVGMRFMEPDNNFVFRSADSVLETPLYQFGGSFGSLGFNGALRDNPVYLEGQKNLARTNLQNGIQDPNNIFYDPNDFTNNLPYLEGQKNIARTNLQNGVRDTNNIFYDPNDFADVTPTSTSPNSNINNNILDNESELQEFEAEQDVQNINNFANTLPDTNNFVDESDKVSNSNRDPFQQNTFYNPFATPTVEQGFRTLGAGIQNGNAGQILAGGAKGLLGSARGFFSGMGSARALQRAQQEREDYQNRISLQPQYVEQGGFIFARPQRTSSIIPSKTRRKKRYRANEQMNEFRELTGDFVTGVEPKLEDDATAEVEKGEFLKDSATGKVQKVLGKTHEQGGEKMFLKEGDKVLTDHLKLGGKKAKLIRDKFDIEVKAKNTFADVLDKYRKKSGLAKATKEEEGLLKKLKEQGESDVVTAPDKTTDKINTQFLLNSLEELRKKKEPLAQGMEGLYDVLFEMQEKSKKGKKNKEEKNEKGQIVAQGGTALDLINSQSGNVDTGLFGNVTEQQFNNFITDNSTWFDFSNFDIRDKDTVKNFQTEFNKRSGEEAQVKVDGLFGEQTVSSRLSGIAAPQGIGTINGISAPVLNNKVNVPTIKNPISTERDVNRIKDTKDTESNLDKGVKNFNKVLPNVPSTYVPFLGQMLLDDLEQVNFREVEPRLQNIDTQLQIAQEQRQIQQRQLEGLSPEMRAAVTANSEANLNRNLQTTASQIDSSNLDRLQRADQANATLDSREQQINAGFQQQFERNNILALDNFNQEVVDNFDTNMNNRLQGFNQINRMNLYLAANPDIGVNFDGTFNSRRPELDPFGTIQAQLNQSNNN